MFSFEIEYGSGAHSMMEGESYFLDSAACTLIITGENGVDEFTIKLEDSDVVTVRNAAGITVKVLYGQGTVEKE